MLNITILSYSLLHICSNSPVFIGNNIYLRNLHFSHLISPSVFINTYSLHIEKSTFNNEIGSLISIDNCPNDPNKDKYENETIETADYETINPGNSRRLFLIRDCTFRVIKSGN